MAAPAQDVVPVELHVVSDSTGETAARLVLALEAQFPDQLFEEVRHPRVETIDDLQLAVNRAKGAARGGRLHARPPRSQTGDADSVPPRARLHYCDLLGHPIDSVARVSGHAASMTPGVRHPLDQTYFRRMEAMEFAVKYDDGMGAGLEEADIVLVGVSRTSKHAPLDLPRLPGLQDRERPDRQGNRSAAELFEIDPAKIVGLTLEASRLAEIRQARLRHMGSSKRQYASSPRSTTSSSRRPRSSAASAAR